MRRFLISLLFALIVCVAPTAGAGDFKAGERKVLTVDGIEYAFRWCPPGEFMMGSPEDEPGRDDEKNDEKRHQVKLTQGFWMLETEVTQEMWKSVMGENLSQFKGKQISKDGNYVPVEFDAITGATKTSNGVKEMIDNTMKEFLGRETQDCETKQ